MRIKQIILEFIQKACEDDDGGKPASATRTIANNEKLVMQELFDGMSTGTARIIIEEEMDTQIADDYNISSLENKGRYYLARIDQPNGRTTRLLVDKQTGKVQLAGR